MFKKMMISMLLTVLLVLVGGVGYLVIKEKGITGIVKEQEEFQGIVSFDSPYKASYIEEQGYTVISEYRENGELQGYLVGYPKVQITVKNDTGKIIGLFYTDQKGNFSFKVEHSRFYQLEFLNERGKVINMTVQSGQSKNLT